MRETSKKYPKSWYPLCRASDVKRGEVIICEALEQRLAVFRTRCGKVGAMDARCCHIGADLGEGWVSEDRLVCPLHHWEFDTAGECVHIPCQEKAPKSAKQSALVCEEHYGQIFAFFFGGPEFPFPEFPGLDKAVFSSPLKVDFDSSYEMAAVNSFDEQHLATVHRRRVLGGQEVTSLTPEHHKIEYRAVIEGNTIYDRILKLIGKRQVHMTLDCWGGNILFFNHVGTTNQMLISLLPVTGETSRAFITTMIRADGGPVNRLFKQALALVLNRFTMLFVNQDARALKHIDFKFINLLPEADANMVKFYQYWKKLPRNE